MEKSIIIIGAGVAGLSTGCYCQMNGYRTQIFEMHTQPGGNCTTWKRKGYNIDLCIHWLIGSRPGTPYSRMWEELGAVQGRNMVYHKEFMRIEGNNGEVLSISDDLNHIEQQMKELAPEDKDVIEEVINAARKMTTLSMSMEKAPELMSPIDGLKMLFSAYPFLKIIRKWGNVTMQDYAQRFKSPFLREVFPLIQDLPSLPAFAMIGLLALLDSKGAGYPIGGSLEFAQAIEQRYRNLGGEVHYKSPITKILVENDRVVGVQMADGSEHRSDIVISAADGRTTIFDMLDGKYVNEKIRGYYDELSVQPPLVFIALGVNRSFDGEPRQVMFPLDEPVTMAGEEWERLNLFIYNFDPTLAPEGKTLLVLMRFTDYDYWKKLSEDPVLYKAEKEKIADTVVDALDRHFPGLVSQVEMRDVATPLTFERYTGDCRGAYMGWQTTEKTVSLRMDKTLPGLSNFYMVGQWVMPGGGLPPSAMSGRHVTQIICKNDKKKFETRTP
jgi:phytoene dehydrogenase-like protein